MYKNVLFIKMKIKAIFQCFWSWFIYCHDLEWLSKGFMTIT